MPRATIKASQGLKDYLVLMSSLEAVTPQEQSRLLSSYMGGEEGALRQLIEAFLPKVVVWVAPRRGGGYSFQELIAIGNCAVIETLKDWRGQAADLEEKIRKSVHEALDTAFKMNA